MSKYITVENPSKINEHIESQLLKDEQDKVLKDQAKAPMMKVQSTGEIKLKDKNRRGGVKFNVLETFGFYPEEIVIQKVYGKNNVIIISGVVPDKVLLKEAEKAKKKGGERK